MPTTYTHAHRFAAVFDSGSAAANAAYNNLALATFGMLVRYNGANDATLFSKGDTGVAISAQSVGGDGRSDLIVQRATTASFWRGDAITIDNTWRWVFFTLNRSTGAHTRHGGPKGGTIASISVTDIIPGSGAVGDDSAQNFTIGANGANNASRTMEIAFVGIWNSLLSVAQAQAVADDLSTAGQPVAAWKPISSSATTVVNYISGPPSMTITGASLVAGPDSAPLVANAFQFVAGTVPDPIITGTPYTIQVEAIDTTQANARVTTYADPAITLGVDPALPSGYVIASGVLVRAMTSGLATFDNIVFALGASAVGADNSLNRARTAIRSDQMSRVMKILHHKRK